MKIACITTSQIPSSTANSMQVMKVCQALCQVGGEVRVWSPGQGTQPWEKLAEHYGLTERFEVQRVSSWRWLRRYDFATESVRQARAWGADLIYTWLAQAAVLGLWQGRPVILEQHDRPTGKIGPKLLQWYVRHPGKKRLLVITSALQRVLEQKYRVTFRPGEIQVAPNGADLERYVALPDSAGARAQLGLPETLTVVYSGHFYSGRGMDLLLGLAQRMPGVQFLWVGGRPEDVASWEGILREKNVKNVLLTGFVENQRLPLYQAAGDVLLMPYERSIAGSSGGNSAEICSPMKMFEYMAAGRAILASDLPVLHEVLNQSNAVFCPPKEVDAWEKYLGELLADAGLRSRLAEQTHRDVTRYTWRARAERALEGMF